MLGAIAGDIIGSVHEASGTKAKRFPLFDPDSRFTDDTVLTVAVADVLLDGGDFASAFHDYFRAYPAAGYGGTFLSWALNRRTEPYNSWGNGSAMRVSPVAYAAPTLDAVLDLARRSAEVTHDHPEGIRGAQATAAAVFLARTGGSKDDIRRQVGALSGYDLTGSVDSIRPGYQFDVSCQGSVPQSIIAFLDSTDFEDAIRNAVSLGGDADTMACIAGAIAEPFYGGVPDAIADEVLARLDERLRAVVARFRTRFAAGASAQPP